MQISLFTGPLLLERAHIHRNIGMLAINLYYAFGESNEGAIAKMDNVSLIIANIRRPD